MKDYKSIFEHYKDIKEIADFIDDVEKLRFYYSTQQFDEMLNHINSLMQKYCVETIVWNTVNNNPPITFQEYYVNAENFLMAQGFKVLFSKGTDVKKHLTNEEIDFIESIINKVSE